MKNINKFIHRALEKLAYESKKRNFKKTERFFGILLKYYIWTVELCKILMKYKKDYINVQIQTVSYCNAKCIMCPYLESWHAAHPGRMSNELFENILMQLKDIRIGRLCLYLQNEPFIDRKMLSRLERAVKELEFKELNISTNASCLPPENSKRLVRLLKDIPHTLWISFHGYDKPSYSKIMGLDYDKTLNNIVELLKLTEKNNINFCIKAAGLPVVDGKKDFQHFTCEDVGKLFDKLQKENHLAKPLNIEFFKYHDRAGSIKRNKYNFNYVRESLTGFYCDRFNKWLHILYNGDVILCCNDYNRKTVIGNLKERSIKELFWGKEYQEMRFKGMGIIKSPDDFICKHCSYPGG